MNDSKEDKVNAIIIATKDDAYRAPELFGVTEANVTKLLGQREILVEEIERLRGLLVGTVGKRNRRRLGSIEREHADLGDVMPIDSWHEDDGPALWWGFPVAEPPYCGTPLDDDFPDYLTHWTRLPEPPLVPFGLLGADR